MNTSSENRFRCIENSYHCYGQRISPVQRMDLVQLLNMQSHILDRVQGAHKKVASISEESLSRTEIKETLLAVLQGQASLLASVTALMQGQVNSLDDAQALRDSQ